MPTASACERVRALRLKQSCVRGSGRQTNARADELNGASSSPQLRSQLECACTRRQRCPAAAPREPPQPPPRSHCSCLVVSALCVIALADGCRVRLCLLLLFTPPDGPERMRPLERLGSSAEAACGTGGGGLIDADSSERPMGQGLPHPESNINGGRQTQHTQTHREQNRFIFDGSSAVVDEQKKLKI